MYINVKYSVFLVWILPGGPGGPVKSRRQVLMKCIPDVKFHWLCLTPDIPNRTEGSHSPVRQIPLVLLQMSSRTFTWKNSFLLVGVKLDKRIQRKGSNYINIVFQIKFHIHVFSRFFHTLDSDSHCPTVSWGLVHYSIYYNYNFLNYIYIENNVAQLFTGRILQTKN